MRLLSASVRDKRKRRISSQWSICYSISQQLTKSICFPASSGHYIIQSHCACQHVTASYYLNFQLSTKVLMFFSLNGGCCIVAKQIKGSRYLQKSGSIISLLIKPELKHKHFLQKTEFSFLW